MSRNEDSNGFLFFIFFVIMAIIGQSFKDIIIEGKRGYDWGCYNLIKENNVLHLEPDTLYKNQNNYTTRADIMDKQIYCIRYDEDMLKKNSSIFNLDIQFSNLIQNNENISKSLPIEMKNHRFIETSYIINYVKKYINRYVSNDSNIEEILNYFYYKKKINNKTCKNLFEKCSHIKEFFGNKTNLENCISFYFTY